MYDYNYKLCKFKNSYLCEITSEKLNSTRKSLTSCFSQVASYRTAFSQVLQYIKLREDRQKIETHIIEKIFGAIIYDKKDITKRQVEKNFFIECSFYKYKTCTK